MPYLGKEPARVPVTAADIPDDSITAAKIVDGVITAADIGDDAVGISELSATGTASNSTFLRGDNSWQVVDSLPSQSGNSGKFLTTDATDASWATISTVFPFFKADGSADNITITNGEFPFYKANGSQDNIGVS